MAGQVNKFSVRTSVEFRSLTAQEIENYWYSGEPKDKAGGYAIQGKGGQFVTSISGSFSNVVGLPQAELHALLSSLGVTRG